MFVVKREFISFEWDKNKRFKNIEKHGIDFPRAARALSQPHLESQSDQNGESRILAICPETERLITIVYTMRGDSCRIISARAARKNEQRAYHQIFGQ
ncbi:BrnT family toxin [Agrobacterium rubi]|uniref:BrnT family toxin n=1 Tax=Agrobacterium rubi TaxID=28099 RepID=A0AAE7UPU7_9HYPH|nr:BrnT family toxin [Agrobacterium rubi]NTE86888.1 BrnT family toxin [Agrobacterium rubi]NTF02822.1 BrnT family toxin [Agrobacterium rubi]NTF37066.1 BrnT family toxin [Agrobacterium rubi]QTF99500.1 BrnT family toxin [Agrobacterium rubi]